MAFWRRPWSNCRSSWRIRSLRWGGGARREEGSERPWELGTWVDQASRSSARSAATCKAELGHLASKQGEDRSDRIGRNQTGEGTEDSETQVPQSHKAGPGIPRVLEQVWTPSPHLPAPHLRPQLQAQVHRSLPQNPLHFRPLRERNLLLHRLPQRWKLPRLSFGAPQPLIEAYGTVEPGTGFP